MYSYDRRTASIPRLQGAILKAMRSLKSNLAELDETLMGDSDGKWDPVQGLSEDVLHDAKNLLKAVKRVNQFRDSRSGLFMR